MKQKTTVGVDGCKDGWLAVAENEGAQLSARIFPKFADLCAEYSDALIAVDIPIGLPERGSRACDIEARRLLGPRRSSVFPAPVASCLGAVTYAEASARHRAVDGRGITQQTFAILSKIHEVERYLRTAVDHTKVIEIHPEVSFRLWGGKPMSHPKLKSAGFAERASLIDQVWPGALAKIRTTLQGRYGKDDLADTFAALWTARRYAHGRSICLPSCSESTSHIHA